MKNRSALVSRNCTGAEQISEQAINKKFIDFINRFLSWPTEKRRSALSDAEMLCGGSDDKYKCLALEFIRDLCREADKRDGEVKKVNELEDKESVFKIIRVLCINADIVNSERHGA